MNFTKLLSIIDEESKTPKAFLPACQKLQELIFEMKVSQLPGLLINIGSIPESIHHDSTAEKLFAKAADIVLARCLHELGLQATVNKERADCADVVAKSRFHEYSLVGDAKVFRLSRTAKNQKDFKVKSMADWRGAHDFAVLACPYFHYPRKSSQIYGQALDSNVALLGWEHFLFLLHSGIRESVTCNLSVVWNLSQQLAAKVSVSDKNNKDNFHRRGNEILCKHLSLSHDALKAQLLKCKVATVNRAEEEIEYWARHIKEVQGYSREQAIAELISALKVNQKVLAIRKFVRQLPQDESIG